MAEEVPLAQGNHHPTIAPYGLFACRAGSVQISVGSDSLWDKFCTLFELDPAAIGLASNAERVANRPLTIRTVETAFSRYEAAELLDKPADAGIPAGKVRSIDEVYEWDQVKSQGLLPYVSG